METHRITTAEDRGRRQDRRPEPYLLCSCGGQLRPIQPSSSVLRCEASGVLAGSVTWQAVTGEAAARAWRAVISPPRSLGQLDLFPGP